MFEVISVIMSIPSKVKVRNIKKFLCVDNFRFMNFMSIYVYYITFKTQYNFLKKKIFFMLFSSSKFNFASNLVPTKMENGIKINYYS